MGGQEGGREGGRAHQKSRGDARLDSLDDGGRPLPPSLVRSLGGSIGRLASEGIFGSLPISLALLPAISRPLSPSSVRQVHRGRHQVRSKMPRAHA